MYQLTVRVYELVGRTRYYAELRESEDEEQEPVATCHLDLDALPVTPFLKHTVMMQQIKTVCDELAQNLADALF